MAAGKSAWLLRLVILTFFLTCSASAQYFSEGWRPGQPSKAASPTSSSASGYTPRQSEQPSVTSKAKSPFDLSTYLESGFLKSLFGRAGINITEKLEAARQTVKLWDERIPLIHDENFEEVIVNEQLTPEEERERAWFLVITVSTAQQEGISKFVDAQFDKAFDLTYNAGDLPHIRWGRIDYMNVTSITTKWGIWRAPFLVILQDRGKTLRFYKAHEIRLNEDVMREFLKSGSWKNTPPWSTAFAPGGSRAFLLDYLAIVLTTIYNYTVLIPRWLLLILTGTFASLLVNLLHRGQKPKSIPAPRTQTPVAGPSSSSAEPKSPISSPQKSPTKTKQRKSGRK